MALFSTPDDDFVGFSQDAFKRLNEQAAASHVLGFGIFLQQLRPRWSLQEFGSCRCTAMDGG